MSDDKIEDQTGPEALQDNQEELSDEERRDVLLTAAKFSALMAATGMSAQAFLLGDVEAQPKKAPIQGPKGKLPKGAHKKDRVPQQKLISKIMGQAVETGDMKKALREHGKLLPPAWKRAFASVTNEELAVIRRLRQRFHEITGVRPIAHNTNVVVRYHGDGTNH